jgi:hypothetical protein
MAAKEYVRSGLWEGASLDIAGLINSAGTKYGHDFALKVAHSLALSSFMKTGTRGKAEAEKGIRCIRLLVFQTARRWIRRGSV